MNGWKAECVHMLRNQFAKFVAAGVLVVGASAFVSPANAATETFGFECITFNLAGDCTIGENQLEVAVSDVTGMSDKIDFTFTNSGPAASSITDIYFDDDANLFDTSFLEIEATSASGVSFSQGSSPGNLPGGNPFDFDATMGLTADSDPPAQPNGVNPGEFLTVRLMTTGGDDFDDVVAALHLGAAQGGVMGALRIGIHVQGFDSGGSESFINVPIPASLSLLLGAFGGLGLLAQRRRRSV